MFEVLFGWKMSDTKSPRLICFSYMLICTISLNLIIAVSCFTKYDFFLSVTDYDGINKKEETKDLENKFRNHRNLY